MPHVRAEAADADVHDPAFGVLADGGRQGDEGDGHLRRHVVRGHARRQGDALGLLGRIAGAQLEVGTEGPALEEDALAGLRLGGQRDVAHVPLAQERAEVVPRQVGGRGVLGQGGGLQLAVQLPLDVRAVAAHAHDVRVPLGRRDGRDGARVDGLHRLLDPPHDPIVAEIEVAEVGVAGPLTGGDVVEHGLHAGRELGVDEAPELVLEQRGRREGRERGHQLLPDLARVAPRLDRVDDRGVGARTPDPLGLEHLDQAGVGEAGRGLRLVAGRLDGAARELVAFRQGR